MAESLLIQCLLLALLVQLVRNEEVKWVHSYSTHESPVQACARLSGNNHKLSQYFTHPFIYLLMQLGGDHIPSLNMVEWNQSMFNNVVANVLNKVILQYAVGEIYHYSLTHYYSLT